MRRLLFGLALISQSLGCAASHALFSSGISPRAVLVVSLDAASPVSKQVAMGSAQNSLAAFVFSNGNIEDVKILDLTVFDEATASGTIVIKPSFSNLTFILMTAGQAVGVGGIPSIRDGRGYYYSFHFVNPVIVPKSSSVSLALKGDVVPFSSAGATENSIHKFGLTDGIVTIGLSSNSLVKVNLSSPVGRAMTVVK